MKNLGFAACMAALLLSADSTADDSALPSTSGAAVLAAIDRMLGASTASAAENEMRDILEFATTENDSVMIVIRPDLIPGESDDESKIDVYFMLFYMAGAIQFDLRHPAEAHDPIADLPSAIRAMITGLRLLKNEQPDVEQPLLEQLAEIDESGGLDGFVDSLR